MLYKPSFCCQCGERIERTDWKLWTNRRFCELCETDFTLQEWAFKIVTGASVAISIIFVGTSFLPADKARNKEPVNLINSPTRADRSAVPSGVKSAPLVPSGSVQDEIPGSPPSGKLNGNEVDSAKSVRSSQKTQTGANLQNGAEPAVYFCGAETKKGTPCSRRVKSPGRCWQHLGQKAMLPESQLVVRK